MKNNSTFNLTEWFGKLFSSSLPTPAASEQPTPIPLACVSVIIPALNEAKRIAEVVRYALEDPATAEVIVIDDSSIDDTALLARQAGARVVTSSMLGKGASMRDGVSLASQSLIAYLDGDLSGLSPGIISRLSEPLLSGNADFVKAKFSRSGGRVTELTAKPMLKVFFPELAHFAQPLGGIISARKDLLQAMTFEDGFGVDIGLLIDAHMSGAVIEEAVIGSIEHESQSLDNLAGMANEVSRVIFDRAKKAGRLHIEQISSMYEIQAQVTGSVQHVLSQRKGRDKLMLIDMDEVVLTANYFDELAKVTGLSAQLRALENIKRASLVPLTAAHIALLFQFVHKEQFQRVARTIAIKPGAVEYINLMRRRGFMVGLVSKGYFVAADIIRRRVFADFALANCIEFELGVCSGKLNLDYDPNESTALQAFLDDDVQPPIKTLWLLQSSESPSVLAKQADRVFTTDASEHAIFNKLSEKLLSEVELTSKEWRIQAQVDQYITV
jgi:glucosyl-3-phosphoglycerate synthase